MGIFDRFKDQAKPKGKDMSDAGEREINEKTGNKYPDRVDDAQAEDRGRDGHGPRTDRPARSAVDPDQPWPRRRARHDAPFDGP
ncbi:antitoxin [Streptomyces mirabilis]|uniref:antitoxin n=1 Tax=Streptomyces mirabilis TaxID=68239 RepID=UPI0036A28077